MNETVEKFESWRWSDPGIGFLPLDGSHEKKPFRPVAYDKDYFEKYLRYAQTAQGEIINQIRAGLVQDWLGLNGINIVKRNGDTAIPVVDVGIGCGSFVAELRGRGVPAYGIDVGQPSIEWLNKRGYQWMIGEAAPILTFWDSFEHIPEPDKFLAVHRPIYIFMSMPIYRSEQEALRSKHFKPGEHCWYFTPSGLTKYLLDCGYEFGEMNFKETIFGGRENIASFVFKRHPL